MNGTRMRRVAIVAVVTVLATVVAAPVAAGEPMAAESTIPLKSSRLGGGGMLLSREEIPDGNWMSLGEGGAEVLLQDHDDATLDAETAKRLTEARRRFLAGCVFLCCCEEEEYHGSNLHLLHARDSSLLFITAMMHNGVKQRIILTDAIMPCCMIRFFFSGRRRGTNVNSSMAVKPTTTITPKVCIARAFLAGSSLSTRAFCVVVCPRRSLLRDLLCC
jgi:hypothetical protein